MRHIDFDIYLFLYAKIIFNFFRVSNIVKKNFFKLFFFRKSLK